MVGDIIQDPGNALIGGAWAAGSWAIHAAVEAYQKNFNQLDQFSRDFLNGFTADDLVDIPPPPAEDLGTVEPKARTASPAYTWEDYYQEMWEQERDRGIQTPLGPEDPKLVLAPVPTQKKIQDPQAPLKPSFVPSPEPVVRQSAGSNLVLEYKNTLGYDYNPSNSPDYVTYPVFRGKTGSQKSINFDQALFFAVPVFTDEGIQWKARIQTLVKGRVTATWGLDAGGKAPQSQDFDLKFKDVNGAFNLSIFQDPFEGDRRTSYPLTESAVPDLVPVPETPGLFDPGGFLDKDREPWEPLPNGADPEPELDLDDLPYPKVPIPPDLLEPPKFPDAVPLNPNNPIVQPNVGTDGEPVPDKGLVPMTRSDLHKIGQTFVNSGAIRANLASVAKEVGRIEQKNAAMIPTIALLANLIPDLIGLLSLLGGGAKAPAKTLTMNAYCNPDEEGNQESYSVIYPEMEMLEGILDRVNDIPGFLEQHLAWKTPTCTNEKVPLEGDWVTLRFVSDEPSPNSNRVIRKLLRYRSKSNASLGSITDYWRGFTWTTGAVVVTHKDAWWGTPQVWAVSADEGKRVLRHVAGEAGIDPDQVGRWEISGSRNPRYGVSLSVRFAELDGGPWVTQRDSASGPSEINR